MRTRILVHHGPIFTTSFTLITSIKVLGPNIVTLVARAPLCEFGSGIQFTLDQRGKALLSEGNLKVI